MRELQKPVGQTGLDTAMALTHGRRREVLPGVSVAAERPVRAGIEQDRRRSAGLRGATLLLLCAILFCCASAIATAQPRALPAGAGARTECRDAPSKILGHAVPYCVFLPPGYDASKEAKFPVLYFLHGLGENAQTLVNAGGWNLIENLWEQRQMGDFLIVTPSAGRSFYVNSRDGRVRYEDFFIREFLPFIESHYRVHATRHDRGITGISMGGYGALRFAFRYPQLFGSASAHSAALVAKLPEVEASSPQQEALSRMMGNAFGSPFDRAYWNRNNPFTLVENGARPAGMKIYFDCGTEDQFGFDAGAQAFHELLAAKKIPHEFHLYPGGHDWIYFADHFPASLEFHSRAFGLESAAK